MNIIIIIVMVAALLTVFVGLGFMIKGGPANQKYSNKLMSLRVALQALAIALLFIVAYFFKR